MKGQPHKNRPKSRSKKAKARRRYLANRAKHSETLVDFSIPINNVSSSAVSSSKGRLESMLQSNSSNIQTATNISSETCSSLPIAFPPPIAEPSSVTPTSPCKAFPLSSVPEPSFVTCTTQCRTFDSSLVAEPSSETCTSPSNAFLPPSVPEPSSDPTPLSAFDSLIAKGPVVGFKIKNSEEDFIITKVEQGFPGNQLPSGRFVCDLAHLIEQVRSLEDHTFTCSFAGKLVFHSYIKSGLKTSLNFVCSSKLCDVRTTISTEREGSKMGNLNELAVQSAISTESSYSQEKRRFGMMNIKYMSQPTFSAYSQKIYPQKIKKENKEKKLTENPLVVQIRPNHQ